MSGDAIELEGIVLEQHRGETFEVEVRIGEVTRRVLCRLSGRLHQHRIRVTPGDEVRCEISAYDPTRGRITFRLTGAKAPRTRSAA